MDPNMEKPPAYTQAPPPGSAYPPPQGGAYPPPQPGAYPPPQPGAYPPPQPGAYPQQPGYPAAQPAATVVVTQPVVVGGFMRLGEFPQQIVCPTCQANVLTSTTYTSGTWTFILALILCLIFWPCAWIPCVMDGTKDVTHQCPNCHNVIGHFRRM